MTVFAIIFGVRHVTTREKHSGLVLAIAFESLIKLLALLILVWVAVNMAFGGFAGMQTWLDANPDRLESFYSPTGEGPWLSLLTLAFAAGFLLPRQFHMIFTENSRPRSLYTAAWGFPLFLLLLAACVPPILWAGQVLGPETQADYYVLGLAMLSESPTLAVFTYLGGISAASAMIIVVTLALSATSLNHLLLPLLKPKPTVDIYASLRWARRALIAAIIAAGYGFYLILEHSEGLVAWGLISFLAMAQFLPGVFGVLFWSGATRAGFIAGLSAGGLIWLFAALLPAVSPINLPLYLFGADLSNLGAYTTTTFWSLAINTLLFAVVSLWKAPDERERDAAAACRNINVRLSSPAVKAGSPKQFIDRLAPVTGSIAAHKEVATALQDLGLSWDEKRPSRLHRLRQQIERNLSGMLGPVLARMIVDEHLQLDPVTRTALARNVQMIEEQLENSHRRFRGVAAELDALRRYHRQILEDLPIGVVAITVNRTVVRWNPAMTRLTGITSHEALGRALEQLSEPWGDFLRDFLESSPEHVHKRALQVREDTRWLSLHRADIAEPGTGLTGDRLLLVVDRTEMQLLEDELAHSERLASIGRLAAGVAHEIGNPVTGIACLAQDLKQETQEAIIHEQLDDILEQTRRISNIVQTLVSYAHAGARNENQPAPIRLRDTVEEARRVVELSKRARSLRFRNRVPADLWVLGDGQRLVQVFVNLFSNAADVCGDGGEVDIAARNYRRMVHIHVRDNGPGIPPAIRDKVLEPFFTTKPAGQGTGLGLPLVYNIVKEHGGELRLDSDQRGTRVLLALPRPEAVLTDSSASI
ncbi:ATP-binding protein [Alkalilimnicola ehrlichii]|uniref:ATP-binding protein n=1 Tax=Alkalilimnicola ehrlichii TaxID=351052 RepID=UPI002163E1B9|nr:ATP-binding protein [Alkalilimnicola ehrlichii]